jgi:exopolysaccharide biosynthesis polyprenyl glycosylphosphotransferase
MDRVSTTNLPHPAETVRSRAAAKSASAPVHWLLRTRRGGARLALTCALLVIAVVGALLISDATVSHVDGRTVVWLLLPLTVLCLALAGTYKQTVKVVVATELLRAVGSTTVATVTLIAAISIVDHGGNPAPLLIRAWLLSTALLAASVPILALVERRARRVGAETIPTLLVGAGQVGTQIERMLSERPSLGFRVVGYIDADPVPFDRVPGRQAPILGAPEQFAQIAEETGAEQVILTFTSSPDSVLIPLIRACENRGIRVTLVPRMFESVNLRVSVEDIGPLPLFNLAWVDPKGWQFMIKHVLDRVLSAILLIALSPLLAVIALAVKLSSPGPILYHQRRIGRDGQRFGMLKFRSMRVDEPPKATEAAAGADIAPGGVEGVDRRTPVGRFIRKYSLDELPQLVNVLFGQMSLIGPRPERPDYVELFDESVRRYSDRHRVKSGITGLAQVSGLRGNTSLAERVELDNFYIQNWSMGLDLRIFLRTFGSLVSDSE